MKKITFVYDPETEQEKLDELLGRLDPKPENDISLAELNLSEYSSDDWLACSLSDSQLKELFEKLKNSDVNIGLLPHPEMEQGKKGFGINTNFEKAWEEIQQAEKNPEIDLMQVNEQVTFNSLVVGT